MKIKNAIIIHGWGGNTKEKPMLWLKQELEQSGLTVDFPQMPHPLEPTIGDWVRTLKEINKKPSQTILIGHSIGCQTILRFLEKEKGIFSGVILIAPWTKLKQGSLDNSEDERIAKSWEETSIDFSKIKNKSNFFEIFYSVNDNFVSVDDVLKIKRELNAGAVNLGEKGHLSDEDGVSQWPEVLEIIEKKCLI